MAFTSMRFLFPVMSLFYW